MESFHNYVFHTANGIIPHCLWGRRGLDRMVVGFTTTYATSAFHQLSFDFESRSWRGVFDTTLYDKVCQ